ncbi:hypothetical protein RHSIM_Rhsim02G0107600 [Rhododendron simsii]|uniref:Uncharacterized protein n=1 Tax=Rhododendron simsii TaxID=118357 RepID=A0A834HGC7_RHOSS|nr:hypothetical protein RHSIM_Rhsim02G0107600 [Rhododendron simsii]
MVNLVSFIIAVVEAKVVHWFYLFGMSSTMPSLAVRRWLTPSPNFACSSQSLSFSTGSSQSCSVMPAYFLEKTWRRLKMRLDKWDDIVTQPLLKDSIDAREDRNGASHELERSVGLKARI